MFLPNRRSFVAGLAGLALAPALARADPDFEIKPDFGSRFSEVGTQGVFAMLRVRDNRLIVSDEGRARFAYVPASTFKVPHALIALGHAAADPKRRPRRSRDTIIVFDDRRQRP